MSAEPAIEHDTLNEDSDRSEEVKVWDLPTRLFHWAIVILVLTSWITADNGWMELHLWSGATMLTLLIFRIVWGLIGSTTARFRDFVAGPRTTIAYLKALGSAAKPVHAGHNPAGGWMVVVMIAVLCTQVVTGLFSNDDIDFNGPLATLISKEFSDDLTTIHGIVFNLILLLVWMHLVAVFFYLLVKGENLIRPMLTGRKAATHVPAGTSISFTALPVALLLLALCAALIWWVLW